jgi:hypothetical protein
MVDPDKNNRTNQLTSIDQWIELDRDTIEGLLCLRTCLAMQAHQQCQQAELEQLTKEIANRRTGEVVLM